jgi:hypothetical protein
MAIASLTSASSAIPTPSLIPTIRQVSPLPVRFALDSPLDLKIPYHYRGFAREMPT